MSTELVRKIASLCHQHLTQLAIERVLTRRLCHRDNLYRQLGDIHGKCTESMNNFISVLKKDDDKNLNVDIEAFLRDE